MELFAAIALLWRHRILVLIGALAAGAVGWQAAQGEVTRIGVASARIALDTPTSQLVDTAPVGADTLTVRAAVLADLAQTEEIATRIARRAGVDPGDLVVKAPYLSAPRVETPLPKNALEASWSSAAPYVLSIQAVPDLPIIGIDSSAAGAREATRLAAAAVEVLKAEATGNPGNPAIQGFVIEQVAPVRAHEVRGGPRRAIAGVAAIGVFGLWCFGIMGVSALTRMARYRRWAPT